MCVSLCQSRHDVSRLRAWRAGKDHPSVISARPQATAVHAALDCHVALAKTKVRERDSRLQKRCSVFSKRPWRKLQGFSRNQRHRRDIDFCQPKGLWAAAACGLPETDTDSSLRGAPATRQSRQSEGYRLPYFARRDEESRALQKRQRVRSGGKSVAAAAS